MRAAVPAAGGAGLDAAAGAAIGAVSAALLVPGLLLMGSAFRAATLVFLAIGTVLLAAADVGPSDWLSALGSMSNTVAILVAMQAFSIPIAMGSYAATIRAWAARRFRTDRSLFVFSTLATHVLTSFLMLGAIPFSTALLGDALRSRVPRFDRFLATALSRGYVLAALWAPGAINLYLVVQATGVAWSAVLVPGLVLAALALGLSVAVESLPGGVLAAARGGSDAAPEPEGPDSPGSKILHVPLAAVSIALAVLALERLGIGSGYTRIMAAGLGVAAVWTAAIAGGGGFRPAAAAYWKVELPKVKDLGPFFVAMGFFSGALEASGALDAAGPALASGAAVLGAWTPALIPLAIVALSLCGLHPFITIALFGKILARAELPLPPIAVALSLATGGAASYMVSPFAGIVMSIAGYTGAKATDVSVRWNGRFVLAFFVLGVLFALLWGAVFP